jgi:hypothetical protein
MFDRILLNALEVILFGISTAFAAPPQEAFVDGLRNVG